MTILDEHGDDIEIPCRWDVCDDCEGEGTTLQEDIRQHAYSVEEFRESFDDEEAEEYFKRGGRYDVPCKTCKGARVVAVPDLDRCSQDERAQVAAWEESEAQAASERSYERRMRERGIEW